ncbi:ABC transporter substrate-binding protein [Paenibacillus oceani]|uniref:Extracellular solute-binding protein n=1 Tax=Paenibacillus oceani TaxID=2772510 RepID=A0A927GYX7_9BACL|nr:extracellular solute-binding protein [Paenibacillus oceani]MBD2861512.1 extracellular solute-binding protein [Paenibacillus oceani]
MHGVKRMKLIASLLFISLTVSACGGSGGSEKTPADEAKAAVAKKELSGTLVVWGDSPAVSEAFMKLHPNVKIESSAPKEHVDAVVVALAAGNGAPDVARVWEAHLWKFGTASGLEDLYAPPYNAKELEKDFLPAAWNLSKSMDEKRLIGLPYTYSPYVMLYRNDIFEQNGFPSKPDEVSKFVSDPENFFDMAKKLRQKGHYMFRRLSEVTDIAAPHTSFYDRSMKYLRNGDTYVKAIDFAKRAAQLDLAFTASKEETDQALNSGKLITYFNLLGSLGSFYEKGGNKADNMGNWRLAQLPLGSAKGWGFDVYVIPSQGKNKEAAWEYAKFAAMSEVATEEYVKSLRLSPYMPSWELPAVKNNSIAGFGGQNAAAFGVEAIKKSQMSPRTPAYADASKIWAEMLEEGIKKNQDSRAILTQIEETMERQLNGLKADIQKSLGTK